MPRLPSSLKWLIDRRARLAGEIERIEESLAKCQRLADDLRPLKDLLASLDQTLSLHDIAVDITQIPTIRSTCVRVNLPHGALTRTILTCLKVNDGMPVSTDEIAAFVVVKNIDLKSDPSSMEELRQSVRYRLKSMCRLGMIGRRHKARGNETGQWVLKEPAAAEIG